MSEEPETPPEPVVEPPMPRKKVGPYLALVITTAVVSLAYRLLVATHYEQTALMFIGLPTLLAVLLAYLPASKTATGMIMRGITLFLLLLGILFIEGFICIVMAAPLFYAIGFIIGIFVDRSRVQRDMNRFRVVILPVLLLMSLEGVTGWLSFPRDEVVVVEQWTSMKPEEAWEELSVGPDFDLSRLPLFLRMGFPMPREIDGTGLEVGDNWRIHFAGGEGKPGDLTAEVVVSGEGRARVVKQDDTSHIAHWLDWQEAEWELIPERGGTRVRLTMRYERLLDPAWYFKPIERYGVRKAGEYFLQETYQ
ncbi:hypothetical protein JIN81_07540 [Haloferula rosea]|uniref:SRPBCC family protein n=2 Tax=Haloferula rosea TaxID=490093 RepID=A0A934R9I9_9BACT|nr:hypothetical protein [Haloferula rosea]